MYWCRKLKRKMKRWFLRLLHLLIVYYLFTLVCSVIYYSAGSIFLWLSEKHCTYAMGLDNCPGGIDLLSCLKNDPITVSLSSKSERQFRFCMGLVTIPEATSWLFFRYFFFYIVCYILSVEVKILTKRETFDWLNYPLHWSVRHDSILLTKYHLYCGCWNVEYHKPRLEVYNVLKLANFHNPAMIRLLVDNLRSAPRVWEHSASVLNLAVKSGNYESIDLLIERGFELNAFGQTALHLAIEAQMPDLVAYLLRKRGTDIFRTYRSPLQTAMQTSNALIIKMLIQAGAHVNRRNISGETSLQYMNGVEDRELLQVLIESAEDINESDSKGYTPLYKATVRGNSVQVELLLAHGANANFVTETGKTLLHIACKISSKVATTIVKLLLKSGLSCNARDREGYTPIHLALEFCNIHVIRSLLEHGADITIPVPTGATPLHLAATNRHKRVLELVLGMRCSNIYAQTPLGGTPLTYAAKSGSVRNFVTLLRRHCCGKELYSETNRQMLCRSLRGACTKYLDADPTYEISETHWSDLIALDVPMLGERVDQVIHAALKYMAVMDFLKRDAPLPFETQLRAHHEDVRSYYSRCQSELELMHKLKLIGPVISVLTAAEKQLARLMRYDGFLTKLKYLKSSFPIYNELLEDLFLRDARVMARRRNANRLIHQVLGPRVATYVVVKHILQYIEPDLMSAFDEPI